MGEHYVRPPLVPREAPAAWRAVWPFRLTALLAVLLLGLLVFALYQQLSGATAQDPGLGAAAVLGP
ncbi:MAG: hypothetical protein JWN57_2914 [Frankiales bacterium]|jgi:hypothetical protein|nr:hypothetical protein [Frankiales bacterium]